MFCWLRGTVFQILTPEFLQLLSSLVAEMNIIIIAFVCITLVIATYNVAALFSYGH